MYYKNQIETVKLVAMKLMQKAPLRLTFLGVVLLFLLIHSIIAIRTMSAATPTVANIPPPVLPAKAAPDSSLEQPTPAITIHALSEPEQSALQIIIAHEGDSLAKIFTHLGLSPHELKELLALPHAEALKNLHPNEKIQISISPDHKLEELIVPINLTESLQINRVGDHFTATVIHHQPLIKLKTASGTIQTTLTHAALNARLTSKQLRQLMNIFGTEINFKKDVKKGDHFSVVYDAYYAGHKQIGLGDIEAAEYVSNGKTYRAIHYIDSKGNSSYYTPTGMSLQSAFTRSPVSYSRISSSFLLSRLDPLTQQYWKPHKGVDFRAPIGTPIRATGNGRINFAGVKRGYGNVIIIQHGSRYQTLYAHMRNFAKGIKRGDYVKEGQVIGYVGMTGSTTGPHLHYEFHVNGIPRNPLTIALPRASGIAAAYREKFIEKAKELMGLLEPEAPTTLTTVSAK